MRFLTAFLLLLCVQARAAVITNWGTQLPNAAPNSADVILMQQGGITRYFTPSQLATNISTNASFLTIISNAIGVSVGGGGASTNIAVGGTLFLDSTFGNDTTAQRTNAAKPYLTASNAVTALQNGDTLVVRGGTTLVNPKTGVGLYSPGLAITNKSNFRITGEPGSVWQLSGYYTTNGGTVGSMLLLVNCTNFLIDRMTFRGLLTNGPSHQDFAICTINCSNFRIEDCVFDDWNDQGITGWNSITENRDVIIRNCVFSDIGGTNNIDPGTVGSDGTAISLMASNMTVRGNIFQRNLRDFEFYSLGVCRNVVFEDNFLEKTRQTSVLFITDPHLVSDVSILNNIFLGYALNPVNVRPTWIECRSISNLVVRGNTVRGYGTAFTYGYGGTTPNTVTTDVWLDGNKYTDMDPIGHYILRDIAQPAATLERFRITNERWHTVAYYSIAINANNSIVQDNEIINGAIFPDAGPQGMIMVGHVTAGASTNSTNIAIIGNRIHGVAASINTTGIVMTAGSYSNIVWGNDVGREYAATLHDVGVGTRGLTHEASAVFLAEVSSPQAGDLTRTKFGTLSAANGTYASAFGRESVAASLGTALGSFANAGPGGSLAAGYNASAAGSASLALASGASSAAGSSMAVGQNSSVAASETYAISLGISAASTGTGTGGGEETTVGSFATNTSFRGTAIGFKAWNQAVSATAIGRGARTTVSHAVAVGRGAYGSVAGVSLGPLQNIGANDVYFFNGHLHRYLDPTDNVTIDVPPGTNSIVLHGPDAYDELNTVNNVAGGDLVLMAGRGTGTATGGKLLFQVAAAGGVANNAKNTAVNAMAITADSKVGVNTASPLSAFHVVGGITQTNGGIWQHFSVGAPSAPAAGTQGAVLWNDGTNFCFVARNSAGALTTNKITHAAWP